MDTHLDRTVVYRFHSTSLLDSCCKYYCLMHNHFHKCQLHKCLYHCCNPIHSFEQLLGIHLTLPTRYIFYSSLLHHLHLHQNMDMNLDIPVVYRFRFLDYRNYPLDSCCKCYCLMHNRFHKCRLHKCLCRCYNPIHSFEQQLGIHLTLPTRYIFYSSLLHHLHLHQNMDTHLDRTVVYHFRSLDYRTYLPDIFGIHHLSMYNHFYIV